MTKGELFRLVLTKEQQRQADIALPQDFVDSFASIGMDVRPYYIWIYDIVGGVTGRPVSLAELFVLKFADPVGKTNKLNEDALIKGTKFHESLFDSIASMTKKDADQVLGNDVLEMNEGIPEDKYQEIFTSLLREESIDSILMFDDVRDTLQKSFHKRIVAVWDARNEK